MLEGPTFSSARAIFYLNDAEIAVANQPDFHTFCIQALGKPARGWHNIAEPLNVRFRSVTTYTGVEQNLAKAAMLILVWLEPYLISGRTQALETELLDELLVDYNAELGVQRHIYFLSKKVVENAQRDKTLDKLYGSQHVCRLNLTMNNLSIDRWFVPLVIPSFPARVDAATRHSWQVIQTQMRDRVQRIVRRMR